MIADPTGKHKYLMFIEGANVPGRNCIGMYYSDDSSCKQWHLVKQHAILLPSDKDTGHWDNAALGKHITPLLVTSFNATAFSVTALWLH